MGEPSVCCAGWRCGGMSGEEGEDLLDGARETLVALGVVVLETDLELDGLDKVALLLAGRLGEELADGAPHACH